VGEGPQQIVHGESDVEVRDIVEITGDVASQVIDTDFAAGGQKRVLHTVRVAAEDHALDGLADVGVLVRGDLVFEAQVAPGILVIAEDLTKPVVGCGEDGHFDLRATTYYAEETCRAMGRVPLEDEAFLENWKTCWRTGTQAPYYKTRDYTPLIERRFRYLAF